jgi:plasmid maintenance system antidote protein VapI
MDKVRRMLEAGVSLPTAIKEALAPLTIKEFAEKYGRAAPTISNVINGNVTANEKDLDALIAEFGGTADEWKLLLWEHSRPVSASA